MEAFQVDSGFSDLVFEKLIKGEVGAVRIGDWGRFVRRERQKTLSLPETGEDLKGGIRDKFERLTGVPQDLLGALRQRNIKEVKIPYVNITFKLSSTKRKEVNGRVKERYIRELLTRGGDNE